MISGIFLVWFFVFFVMIWWEAIGISYTQLIDRLIGLAYDGSNEERLIHRG